MTTPRRTFLRHAALATTTLLAVSPSLFGAERPAGRRRIGFVDLNLDNYHANVFLQALRGPLKDRGFTVAGCTGTATDASRAWAEKNGIPYFDADARLNEAVDGFMILAPSNPEVHMALCERILSFGKPCCVDKTFAPDAATARRIFALADQHRTPVQTTSALRYTNVQEAAAGAGPVEHMITWGGGGSFDEYAIHPLELLISVMGPEATGLMRRGTAERTQLLINFSEDRTGVVNVYPKSQTAFAASITTREATRHVEVDVSKIFVNNMAAVLDFFASGQPNVDRRESMVLMELLDAARNRRAMEGFLPV